MCAQNPKRTPWFGLHAKCLLVGLAATFLLSQSGLARQTDGREAKLPQHALWRFSDQANNDSNGIYRLQYSRDGKLLATRNRRNVVSVYSITTRKLICEINGHENNWVETIDFTPDSKHVVTAAGSSEKVKIWNSQTGELESEIDTDASAAYFTESGTAINVLGRSHVEVYSWPDLKLTSQQKWKNGNESPAGMSKDGRLVVSLKKVNRQIYQTQVANLETKSRISLTGVAGIPKAVAISSNRVWIAASFNRDNKVRLWDLRDPQQKTYTLKRHDETVQSLAFSSDNRFLISSGWDEKVVAWDLATRQPLGQFDGHTEHVNATAFAPLDLAFASGASGTSDTSTIVWNLEDVLRQYVTPNGDNKTFDQIWKGLGGNALDVSLDSAFRLIDGQHEFLDQLDKRTGDAESRRSKGTFETTIKLLEHPQWMIRERTTEQLIQVRDKFDAELRLALSRATSPEIRYRILKVINHEAIRRRSNFAEQRRWNRIIFALELMNSPRSQSILEKIANINLDIDVAEDARASFRRNEQRNLLNASE